MTELQFVLDNQNRIIKAMAESSRDYERIQIDKWKDKAKDCPLKFILCGAGCSYTLCVMRHWGLI